MLHAYLSIKSDWNPGSESPTYWDVIGTWRAEVAPKSIFSMREIRPKRTRTAAPAPSHGPRSSGEALEVFGREGGRELPERLGVPHEYVQVPEHLLAAYRQRGPARHRKPVVITSQHIDVDAGVLIWWA